MKTALLIGGWRQGSASILNACLYADAKQVQTSVAALKLLRAGERPHVDQMVGYLLSRQK